MDVLAEHVADASEPLAIGALQSIGIDANLVPFLVTHSGIDPRAPAALTAWWQDSSKSWAHVELETRGLIGPHVEHLTDGRWLAVGRSADDIPVSHARLYDDRGIRTQPDCVVWDGIHLVQADVENRVWLGQFDEGVFGEGPGDGLGCFDLAGHELFSFRSTWDILEPIAECYALNVTVDGDVWLCYYTDFPLIRLVDFKVAGVWREFAPAGVGEFAVSYPWVLFGPGYKRSSPLRLADLSKRATRTSVEVSLVDSAGNRVDTSGWRAARSGRFILMDGSQVYSVSVADMPKPW